MRKRCKTCKHALWDIVGLWEGKCNVRKNPYIATGSGFTYHPLPGPLDIFEESGCDDLYEMHDWWKERLSDEEKMQNL